MKVFNLRLDISEVIKLLVRQHSVKLGFLRYIISKRPLMIRRRLLPRNLTAIFLYIKSAMRYN